METARIIYQPGFFNTINVKLLTTSTQNVKIYFKEQKNKNRILKPVEIIQLQYTKT